MLGSLTHGFLHLLPYIMVLLGPSLTSRLHSANAIKFPVAKFFCWIRRQYLQHRSYTTEWQTAKAPPHGTSAVVLTTTARRRCLSLSDKFEASSMTSSISWRSSWITTSFLLRSPFCLCPTSSAPFYWLRIVGEDVGCVSIFKYSFDRWSFNNCGITCHSCELVVGTYCLPIHTRFSHVCS